MRFSALPLPQSLLSRLLKKPGYGFTSAGGIPNLSYSFFNSGYDTHNRSFGMFLDGVKSWIYLAPQLKTGERQRWLADGRLPRAGTRTLRLAGRARQITFHVFDPKVVEDLLDRGVIDEWRVEDAKAEKRAKAAYQRKVARLSKKKKQTKKDQKVTEHPASSLQGWDDFGLDGLLRQSNGA